MNRTRLLLLALIASLGINLFFIGGIAYRVNRSDDFSGRPLPPNVNWMVRDLSDARRAELAPLLQRSADELRPVRRQMFDAQRRVNALMADPMYDPVALEQAFAELRAANLRYQEMSHEHSAAMLAELTEAERLAAVEFINRRGPRDGDGRRGNRPALPPRPAGPGNPPPFPPADNL